MNRNGQIFWSDTYSVTLYHEYLPYLRERERELLFIVFALQIRKKERETERQRENEQFNQLAVQIPSIFIGIW